MKNKIGYFVLAMAVAVLVAIGAPGTVLADNEGAGVYGTTEHSFSSEPDVALEGSYSGEIRDPMETGSLPDESMTQDPEGWVNIDVAEQNASPELRDRPNIQAGGGGD